MADIIAVDDFLPPTLVYGREILRGRREQLDRHSEFPHVYEDYRGIWFSGDTIFNEHNPQCLRSIFDGKVGECKSGGYQWI